MRLCAARRMFDRKPTRQSSPFRLKRLRYLLSRIGGTRLQKDKQLHFVTTNGHRYKRMVLGDSFLAAEFERSLLVFDGSSHFPALVTRYDRELWVEFIVGTPATEGTADIAKKLADFYAVVYGRHSRQVDSADSPYPGELARDLRFLQQVGVLSVPVHDDLAVAAERLTPPQLWVGFDYSDPVLKNFVLRGETGELCAVDVDGLAADQLIGMGLNKARRRWLEPYEGEFFERLFAGDVPDFRPYLPFLELCFLVRWFKRSYFEHKWKVIEPALFERYRHLG